MLFDEAIEYSGFSTDPFVKSVDWGAPQMKKPNATRTVAGGAAVSVASMMPNTVSYYSYSGRGYSARRVVGHLFRPFCAIHSCGGGTLHWVTGA